MGKPGSFRPGTRSRAGLCPVRAPCPSAAALPAPGRPLPCQGTPAPSLWPLWWILRACGQAAKHLAPLAACPGRRCPRIRPAPVYGLGAVEEPWHHRQPSRWGTSTSREKVGEGRGRAGGSRKHPQPRRESGQRTEREQRGARPLGAPFPARLPSPGRLPFPGTLLLYWPSLAEGKARCWDLGLGVPRGVHSRERGPGDTPEGIKDKRKGQVRCEKGFSHRAIKLRQESGVPKDLVLLPGWKQPSDLLPATGKSSLWKESQGT